MNTQQLRGSILQEAVEGRLVPQDPNGVRQRPALSASWRRLRN